MWVLVQKITFLIKLLSTHHETAYSSSSGTNIIPLLICFPKIVAELWEHFLNSVANRHGKAVCNFECMPEPFKKCWAVFTFLQISVPIKETVLHLIPPFSSLPTHTWALRSQIPLRTSLSPSNAWGLPRWWVLITLSGFMCGLVWFAIVSWLLIWALNCSLLIPTSPATLWAY